MSAIDDRHPGPAFWRTNKAGDGAVARGLAAAFAVMVAAVVALPVLTVAFSLAAPSTGVLRHLAETVLVEVVFNTLGLMLFVGFGVTVIGVGIAWLVTMCRFPGSRLLEWALLMPLAMPAYIIGYAYTDLMTFAGPLQSLLRAQTGWGHGDYWFPDIHGLGGAGLMLSLVLYPYVYIIARAAFLDQSVCVLEASRTLGAGPWRAFGAVALPMARPAIAAGVALALMEALADFGTVQYFGVTTFTTTIYRTWFGMGDRVAAGQLATALLVFVVVLVLVERRSRPDRAGVVSARRHRPLAPLPLKPLAGALALFACALPILLGFLIPVAVLIGLHAQGGDPFLGPRFLHYATNSFLLAGVASILIVAVAATLTASARLLPGPVVASSLRVAGLGYAIPGTVIAVGILVPLGALDQFLDATIRAHMGWGTGLVFSGTAVALLYAYLVRFLGVATGTLEAGLHRIPGSLDAAARTLGSGLVGVARRIHAPLVRRSVVTAGLLVFVDVLKELPATLIVRPFDFDTLAVRVYTLASDERLAQASTGALVIVAIGLLPVIVLTRMIAEERRSGERF